MNGGRGQETMNRRRGQRTMSGRLMDNERAQTMRAYFSFHRHREQHTPAHREAALSEDKFTCAHNCMHTCAHNCMHTCAHNCMHTCARAHHATVRPGRQATLAHSCSSLSRAGACHFSLVKRSLLCMTQPTHFGHDVPHA